MVQSLLVRTAGSEETFPLMATEKLLLATIAILPLMYILILADMQSVHMIGELATVRSILKVSGMGHGLVLEALL